MKKIKNGNYTSAQGILNEYLYNKELAPLVKEYLEKSGYSVTLIICREGQFSKSTEERNYKLNIVNKGGFDLVVELHLNAGGGTGSEVLYISDAGRIYAERIQTKIAIIFRNRGVKKKSNLYMLNATKPVAILIAEGIVGQSVKSQERDNARKLYKKCNSHWKNVTYMQTHCILKGQQLYYPY